MQQPDDQQNMQPQQAPQPMLNPDDPNMPVLFAQTNFRAQNQRFGIKLDDRRRHMYVIGKTGMGKSTLLENMIIQDIQAGRGLAVVDPHGDLVEKVLDFVPQHRMDDVIYFNPSDTLNPIAFNVFEEVDPEYRHLIVNGLVGVFKKIWADSWGPRLEYILINAISALMEYPGATLLGVTRLLVDGAYRKRVLRKVNDPMVKSFWVNEFNNYSEKFRNEAIAPIQNKVGQFLSSALIRNIVGQEKSAFDVREAMDNRKVLLMNLSKGRIGEENSALLGAMMITKIQLAAMSRVDTPEHERKDFYLYVDEFQNFSTESFAGILSEARKYRLSIIMAHQYIEQLNDEVRAAVFGNVGTMITFRVGATDAEELEKEYEPAFTKEDLVTLPAYQIYLRLMIDGVASEPFSANTLPPIEGHTGSHDAVVDASRNLYAGNKDEIEEGIAEWSHPDPEEYRKQKAAEAKERAEKEAEEQKNQPEPTQQIEPPKEKDARVNTTGHKLPPLPPKAVEDELHPLRQKHVDFIQTVDKHIEEMETQTKQHEQKSDTKEQDSDSNGTADSKAKKGKNNEEDKKEETSKKELAKDPAEVPLHELSEEEKKKKFEEARKKFAKPKGKNDSEKKKNKKESESSNQKQQNQENKNSDKQSVKSTQQQGQSGKKTQEKETPKSKDNGNEQNQDSKNSSDKKAEDDSAASDQPKKKKRRRRRKKSSEKRDDRNTQPSDSGRNTESKPPQQHKPTEEKKADSDNIQRQSQPKQQQHQPKAMKPGEHVQFNKDD